MLLAHFQRRGYPIDVLQMVMDKVKTLNRTDLLKERRPEEEEDMENGKLNIISLLTSYVPQCDELAILVKNNWGIVQRSSTTETPHTIAHGLNTMDKSPAIKPNCRNWKNAHV